MEDERLPQEIDEESGPDIESEATREDEAAQHEEQGATIPEQTVDESPATATETGSSAAVEPARRSLKLVLSLQPAEGAGYRAMLAVGADGCDPVMRSAEVADLAGAIDALPGLIEEAEARWRVEPRYPAALPTKAKPVATSGPAPAPKQGPAPSNAPAALGDSPPAAKAGAPDQLSLFG